MKEKHSIQVRNGDGSIVETIQRVVWCEPIGNYAPVFCRYKGKRQLVESDELHLDDPLRCDKADHIGKLFIRPRDDGGRIVQTWGLT